MKAFQVIQPGKGVVTDIVEPLILNDQILVKIAYCGICGTDYDLFSGKSEFIANGQATYPIRLGHEWSGRVAAVGKNVRKFAVGDRVVGDNYISCGLCKACKNKEYNNCLNRRHVGTINPCWPGALAEYYLVPERHVYPVADHVPLIEAALCEPLSIAYGGIKKMNIKEGTVTAVIGTGSIAMSAAALAAMQGGEVYVIGRNAIKLDVAKKLGVHDIINSQNGDVREQLLALTGGREAEYVLECSGADTMAVETVRISAQKAVVAMIGFYSAAPVPFDLNTLVVKEISMIGIMGEYGNLEAVSKIMADNDLRLKEIITGVVPFADCAAAFTPSDPQRVIKTMIEITKE